MDYDILILGGGLIGCAVAYELSKYNLNIALIEKDYDIADDIAFINTAIVYDGIEADDDLMAKLEVIGNGIIDKLSDKFDIPFKRIGSLIIAEDDKQVENIKKIYNRAVKRGINGIELIGSDKIKELEPNIKSKAKMAIYSNNTGVICPYDLALAYAEIAFDNGVNFRLEEEVLDIQKSSKGLKVTTSKNKFTSKIVINTTPYESYDIEEAVDGVKEQEKITYFVLEKEYKEHFNHIIYSTGENKNKFYAIPSLTGNTITAVSGKEKVHVNDGVDRISEVISEINLEGVNNIYHDYIYNDMIMVEDSDIEKRGYIKITGKNFSEVTITPAIANMVCETVINNLKCTEKKNFIDKRRDFYRFKEMNNEDRNELIKIDPRYANIICLCNQVTEAEIIDSIRRPLGARTVEGIKRRTGVTFGSCQGSYCLSRIISILARETNKKLTDIVKDSKNSKMIKSRIKEFDEV